ncbi:MAG: porin family protein [Muribaculaceae bacterium]|nr:porin family protein [Muribaculaceae bacterium]
MKRIILLFALCGFLTAAAQENRSASKWSFELGYQYQLGLSESAGGYTVKHSQVNMYGNGVQIGAFYELSRRLSLGLELSFIGYEPSPNYLPISVSARVRPFDGVWHNLYAFGSLGYAPGKSGDANLNCGFNAALGLGWRQMFRPHLGVNVRVGYYPAQFRHAEAVNDFYNPGAANGDYIQGSAGSMDAWRHSLGFSVGLVF